MKKSSVLLAVLLCFTSTMQANAATPHMYNPEDDTISGQTITGHNSSKSNQDKYTGYGGAVMYYSEQDKKHTIEDATFQDNHAHLNSGSAWGGAIYSTSELTINNTTFDNNYVNTQDQASGRVSYGGAIAAGAKLTVNNSKFTNNNAKITTGNSAYGGAIYSSAETYITDTLFDNNSANVGGAVFNVQKMTINGGSFTGNGAAYYGGAIYSYKGATLDIDGTQFTNNKTTTSTMTGQGGAIYLQDNANGTVKNAKFTGNSASNAGAIYSNTGTLSVTNTAFNNNTATGNGKQDNAYGNAGAVYSKGNTTITGSSFNGNTANSWGGAVFQDKNGSSDTQLTVENSSFASNKAAAAGAIVTSAQTTIKSSIFKSNTATNGFGGAVFNSAANKELKVENSGFTSNSALRGGAIYGQKDTQTKVDGGLFSGNIVTGRIDNAGNPIYGQGGAIFTNRENAKLTVNSAVFSGNTAENEGGAIWSGNTTTIKDSVFENNKTTGTHFAEKGKPDFEKDSEGGGAIFVGSNSKTTIESSDFIGNSSSTVGGAIATRSNINSSAEAIKISGSTFRGNSAEINGGAIGSYAKVTLTDTNFVNNKAGDKGGAIWANGDVTIKADNSDVIFSGNTATDGADIYMDNVVSEGVTPPQSKKTGKLELNAGAERNIVLTDGVSGADKYEMELSGAGKVTFNGEIKNANMTLEKGTLHLAQGSSLNNTVVNLKSNTTLDTTDGAITNYQDSVKYENSEEGKINLRVDISTATGQADKFGGIKGKVKLDDFNPIGDTLVSNGSITNEQLKGIMGLEDVELEIAEKSHQFMSPLRRLNATSGQNGISFAPTGNTYNDFNPAVMASPIAAQLGGYLTQLNSYDEAFRNMDMYMLMPSSQRQAMKTKNKYAASDSNLAFNPINTPYENSAVWARPYSTFENVEMKHGPKVSNVAYGSYFGTDSPLYELGNGWDAMWGVYAGYNGSHQAYQGVDIYQNGATLGLTGMLYRGNFFTGLTANVGSNAAAEHSLYGEDDFALLMTGVASKTGYNWELADGKFIIQPSYLMSYSLINTFNYTNAAGIRINPDVLNAIQLEPGLKIIGNFESGWQPYAGVSVVWNLLDKTDFMASDATLPELSIKPFIKYGVGVRKTGGERFTGYGQTYFTGGGRNGMGVQVGGRWSLGKKYKADSNNNKNLAYKN